MMEITGPRFDGLNTSTIFSTTLAALDIGYIGYMPNSSEQITILRITGPSNPKLVLSLRITIPNPICFGGSLGNLAKYLEDHPRTDVSFGNNHG